MCIFRISQLLCFIMNPLMIVYLIVFALTWSSFGELSLLALSKRALYASMDALTFSIVDSIVRSLFINMNFNNKSKNEFRGAFDCRCNHSALCTTTALCATRKLSLYLTLYMVKTTANSTPNSILSKYPKLIII